MRKKMKTIFLTSLMFLVFSLPGNSRNVFQRLRRGIKYRHSVEFKLKNMNRRSIYVKIYYKNRHKKRKYKRFRLRRGQTKTFRVRKNSRIRLYYGYPGKRKKYRRIRIKKRGMRITLRGLRYVRRRRFSKLKIRNRTGRRIYVRLTYYRRRRRRKKFFWLGRRNSRTVIARRGSRFKIVYGRRRFGRKKRRSGRIRGRKKYVYLR